jgi:succinate-semialdehyde dehydrogenase/glutarate-semialdehyde dehydrogenase
MKSINPATLEVLAEYPSYTDAELEDILTGSHRAAVAHARTPFESRSRLMHRVAEILLDRRDEYAGLLTSEMGKPIVQARSEIEKCAWVCRYFADHAEEFLADEKLESDASDSFVSFEPLGVVLAVMPWNYPFWQVLRFAAPAVMAGNGALLKHASNVSGCALALEDLFRRAGFDEDLFRTVLVEGSRAEALVGDRRIAAVTLTGSGPAGRAVAAAAGRALKPSVMELGGSDPYIVLEDSNLPACVETSVTARMQNTGQSCIAAKRFIVVEPVVDQFTQLHVDRVRSLTVGDPMSEDTDIGPLARADLVDELDAQVRHSVDAGAKLLCGGKRVEGPGVYYEPTVLTDVRKGMPAFDEETFGPVSAIVSVASEEEAIAVANDSFFGLGAAIWTLDLLKARRMAHSIAAGAVFINGMTKSDPRLPFGGIKGSGYGRELSAFGIREFVNKKTVWIG